MGFKKFSKLRASEETQTKVPTAKPEDQRTISMTHTEEAK